MAGVSLSGAALAGASALGPEATAAVAAVEGVADAIKGAMDALKDFVSASVEASNPGVWQRYQRSIQDVGAVFGQAFAPLVEYATTLTDQFNGVLTEIAPVVGEIVDAFVSDLKPVMDDVIGLALQMADSFKDSLSLWGGPLKYVMEAVAAAADLAISAFSDIFDIIQSLSEAFVAFLGGAGGWEDFWKKTVEGIKLVVAVVKDLMAILAELAKQLAKTGAVDLEKAAKDAFAAEDARKKRAQDAGKNKTFAARPAEFSSLEDIARTTQLAAASLGAGAQKSPEASMADIAAAVEGMRAWMLQKARQLDEFFAEVKGMYGLFTGQPIKDAAKAGVAAAEANPAAAATILAGLFGL